MKNNDRLLKSTVMAAVTLVHVGIGALAWTASDKSEKIYDSDNLTFVDLGSIDGDDKPAAEGAPAPLQSAETILPPPPQPEIQQPKPQPKPEPIKPAEQPKVSAVKRDDVPADFRQPKKPVEKNKPVEKPIEKPIEKPLKPIEQAKPQLEKPLTPSNAVHTNANTNTNSHSAGANNPNAINRAANGNGGGGTDPNSKVPGNGASGEKGGDGHGAKGTGDGKSGSGGGKTADGGYISLPNPPYPRSAQENEEEGTVKLSVVVDANGSVVSVSVMKSSGSAALDAAAKRAAQNARYRPKQIDGENVKTRFNTSFTFQLGE